MATAQQNPPTTVTSSHVPQQKFQSQSQFENQSHNFHQVVPPQQQSFVFVSPYPQQFNNFRNQNRSRGFKNQRNGSRAPCQICDRTNHTAKDCYYRLNLQYSSPSYSSFVPSSPIPQAHMLQSPSSTHYQPPSVSQSYSSSVNARLLPTPQIYFSPTQSFPHPYPASHIVLPTLHLLLVLALPQLHHI